MSLSYARGLFRNIGAFRYNGILRNVPGSLISPRLCHDVIKKMRHSSAEHIKMEEENRGGEEEEEERN